MAGGGSKDGKGGAEAARAAPKKKRGWRCAERPAREREGLLACSRHAVNDPVPLELAAGSKIGPGVEGVDRGIRPCARSCRDPYLQMKWRQSGICGGPARAKCANFFLRRRYSRLVEAGVYWLLRAECGRETRWGDGTWCPRPVTGRAAHRCSAFTELPP